MQKKITPIIIIILIIAVGAWVLNREDNSTPGPSATNGSMIQDETGTETMYQENVEYFPGVKGYFVRPKEEEEFPAVILVHDNRGLRPEIRMMADLLAKNGYMVLAVDLLGAPVETQKEALALIAKFDQKKGIANMRAAANFLREEGAVKIGSLGWGFGGAQSLQLAMSGEKMDATAIYYGQLITTTNVLKTIKWPVLGVFGDADQVVSTTSVAQFKNVLNELKVENEIYTYPGVGYAFTDPSGENYAPTETKDAWAKTVAFFNKHLK